MGSENIETVRTSKNDILNAATSQLDIITYELIKSQGSPLSVAVKTYVKLVSTTIEEVRID